MSKEIAQIVALIIFAILAIGNLRYLHNLISSISKLCRELITLIVRFSTVCKQVEYNYEAIKRINEELKINGRRATAYIKDLHHDNLCNTGRIHLLLKTNKIGMYECNHKGECIWVNDSVCDLFGLEHDELLGHGWSSCIVEEHRSIIVKEWLNCIEFDIPYSAGYNIINKKTGENIRVSTTAISIRDDDGKPILFCGSISRV